MVKKDMVKVDTSFTKKERDKAKIVLGNIQPEHKFVYQDGRYYLFIPKTDLKFWQMYFGTSGYWAGERRKMKRMI